MGAAGPRRLQNEGEDDRQSASIAWLAGQKSDFFALPEEFKRQLMADISTRFGNCHAFVASRAQPLNMVDGKFLDLTFPPEKQSLIRFWNQADIVSQVEWEKYAWVRLSELFKENKLAIFDDIQPDDILQGSLGDCYFLSALSAIAEVPDRIKRLFITTTVPDDCCYRVWLLNLGMWTEYCLDDFFPVKTASDPPKKPGKFGPTAPRSHPLAFSCPRIEKGLVELWVLLLEKAWAKKYQSFYDIQAGYTDEVLTDLTGAPCETLGIRSPQLWERIVRADEERYILTAGCVGKSADADELYQSLGLLVDHSYALISAKEITVAGEKVRLLKVRNPWGNFEWMGDWSDASSKWTEEARQQVAFTPATDDGSFWISFEDFQRYFESCTICHVHDSYWTVSLAMDQTKDEEFSVVELKANRKTMLYFMVCQIDERRFGGIEAGYQYAPVRLIAATRTLDNSLHYLTGKMSGFSREAWLQLEVDPGVHLFYIEMNWRSTATDLFGVSAYSEHEVIIRDATSENLDFMQRCYADEFLETQKPTHEFGTAEFEYVCYKLVGEKDSGELKEGVYVDAFRNMLEEQAIILTVRHEPWVNTKLLKPYDDENAKGAFEVELGPSQQAIVIKKQANLLSKHSFKVLVKKKLLS